MLPWLPLQGRAPGINHWTQNTILWSHIISSHRCVSHTLVAEKCSAPVRPEVEKNKTFAARGNRYSQVFIFLFIRKSGGRQYHGCCSGLAIIEDLGPSCLSNLLSLICQGHLFVTRWLEQLQLSHPFMSVSKSRKRRVGSPSSFIRWSGASLSQFPSPSNQGRKIFHHNRLSIVPHQSELACMAPLAAGEPDKVSIWYFQPVSREAGSASVEKRVGHGSWVQRQQDKTQGNNILNVQEQQYQIFAPDHHAVETQLPEFPPCGAWNYSHWWQSSITSSFSWENWVFPEIQYQATSWEQVYLADQMRNNGSCLIIQSNVKEASFIQFFGTQNSRLQMSRKLGLDCKSFPSGKTNHNLAYFSKNQLSYSRQSNE